MKPWQPEIAKAAGARFTIVRAGSVNGITGIPYEDYEWNNNLKTIDVLPTSTYWYFRPNWSVVKQADFWTKLLEPHYEKLVDMWCDTEEKGGLDPERAADAVESFLEKMKKNLGEHPGIYTRATFWNPNIASRPLWKKTRLWVAMFNPTVPHPWKGLHKQYKPRDWDEATLWQWSANGNGQGKRYGAHSYSIDLDRFMGDETAFQNYIDRKEVTPELSLEEKVKRLWEAHPQLHS